MHLPIILFMGTFPYYSTFLIMICIRTAFRIKSKLNKMSLKLWQLFTYTAYHFQEVKYSLLLERMIMSALQKKL